MKSWLGCIGLVAVAVLTSAACSEADPVPGAGGSAGNGGGAGTAGAGGSTGGSGGSGAEDGGGDDGGLGPGTTKGCVTVYEADKIEYTASTVPVYTCNGMKSTNYPTGANACRNDPDCAIINTGRVREMVKACALGCRSYEPMPGVPEAERVMKCNQMADCNTTCVQMATSMIMQPGITNGCGKCYTDVALCSIAECLSECSVDADAIPCIKCQFAAGCRVPYERCSGLDRQQ